MIIILKRKRLFSNIKIYVWLNMNSFIFSKHRDKVLNYLMRIIFSVSCVIRVSVYIHRTTDVIDFKSNFQFIFWICCILYCISILSKRRHLSPSERKKTWIKEWFLYYKENIAINHVQKYVKQTRTKKRIKTKFILSISNLSSYQHKKRY